LPTGRQQPARVSFRFVRQEKLGHASHGSLRTNHPFWVIRVNPRESVAA
jgi:hypothetical protein